MTSHDNIDRVFLHDENEDTSWCDERIDDEDKEFISVDLLTRLLEKWGKQAIPANVILSLFK